MFGLFGSDGTSAEQQGFGGYLYKLKRKKSVLLPQWNKRYFFVIIIYIYLY